MSDIFERAVIDLEKLKPHGVEMWLHSIRRYQFAASYLTKQDSVIDICCGSGYGTDIMAQRAKSVLGIDKSIEAIKFAKEKYPACDYREIDIVHREFHFSYNIAVLFEGLDHIGKEDGKKLLAKLPKICTDMAFLSLPQDQRLEANPYHLAEWAAEELKEELERYFHRVVLFGQSWSSGIISYPYDERRSITVFLALQPQER